MLKKKLHGKWYACVSACMCVLCLNSENIAHIRSNAWWKRYTIIWFVCYIIGLVKSTYFSARHPLIIGCGIFFLFFLFFCMNTVHNLRYIFFFLFRLINSVVHLKKNLNQHLWNIVHINFIASIWLVYIRFFQLFPKCCGKYCLIVIRSAGW